MIDYSKLAADHIVQIIDESLSSVIGEFFNGKMLLRRFDITQDSPIFRSRIIDFTDADFPWPFSIVTLIRDGRVIIPKGDTVMEDHDTIYVLLPAASIAEFLTFINPIPYKTNNIFIYGDNPLGKIIAQRLRDLKKIVFLVSENKDGLKEDFIKAHKPSIDIFIALTDSYGHNLASALCAKKNSIKTTIVVIPFGQEAKSCKKENVDFFIDTNSLVCDCPNTHTQDQDFSAIKKNFKYDVNILEFVAEKGSVVIKMPIKDLDIPSNCIIGAVRRRQEVFLAKGNTQIGRDDRVIVFSYKVDKKKLQALFMHKRLFEKAF